MNLKKWKNKKMIYLTDSIRSFKIIKELIRNTLKNMYKLDFFIYKIISINNMIHKINKFLQSIISYRISNKNSNKKIKKYKYKCLIIKIYLRNNFKTWVINNNKLRKI